MVKMLTNEYVKELADKYLRGEFCKETEYKNGKFIVNDEYGTWFETKEEILFNVIEMLGENYEL